jgi:hypothetical protein
VIPLPTVQVWDAAGSSALGVLAGYQSLTISEVFCDVGVCNLVVGLDTVGAGLLDVDTDWQLKVIGLTADPMWFTSDDDSLTRVSDAPESEPITVACRSLHALLDEAKVIPSTGVGAAPAEWAFTTATPGRIVKDLFDSAQTRSLIPGVTLSGGAVNDASGTPWPDTVTVIYRAGQSLLEVLAGLRDALLIEYRFVGQVLELHRPGGDMDRSPDVTLRPGSDVTGAPLTRTRKPQATAVIVEGAEGVTARRTQALVGRRPREAYVSESTATAGTLGVIGDLYLAAHVTPDTQWTTDLTDGPTTPLPLRGYLVGDRPVIHATGPTPTRRRVMQIGLTMSETETKVTLELGSLLRDSEEQMARKLARLLPGEGAVT